MNDTPTQQLLQFIIQQEKDLSEYWNMVQPISEKFYITEWGTAVEVPATVKLIATIIDWENHRFIGSLEETINQRFRVRIGNKRDLLGPIPPTHNTKFFRHGK